jgi:tetratricopeptide (TPR) repeat protein
MANSVRKITLALLRNFSNGARKMRVVIIVLLICFFQQEHLYVYAQSNALRNVEALVLKDAYAQAVKECEKILAHQHKSSIRAKTHYLLGICLLKEKKYEEARKNFTKILRRFSRSKYDDDAAMGVADSYFLAGDYEEAKKRYNAFLRNFMHSELTAIANKSLELCKQGRRYINSYFSVQLGSFAKKKNAEKLRDELINSGYQAYILSLPSDGLHRVRVGRFGNRLDAEFLEQRLKSEGYSTRVCP